MNWLKQKTLRSSVTFEGVGLHTGQKVTMHVAPAEQNTGILFKREDTTIKSHVDFLESTRFCTTLAHENLQVQTTEHFLSAAMALGLDNLRIYLDSAELPCLDGSSYEFYWGLQAAGIIEQDCAKEFYQITQPVKVEDEQSYAQILPANTPNICVELDYQEPIIKAGGLSMNFDLFEEDYASQIARARTYGFKRDFQFFQKHHLAQGATLDNCLVLSEKEALSHGGARFTNEPVRHKILDVLGDMALLGKMFLGKYQAFKPGHTLNLKLVKKILETGSYQPVTLQTRSNTGQVICE